MASGSLTPEEVQLLEACKAQHPGWWAGMLHAARVMPDRNRKYANTDTGNSPWANFIIMARLLGVPVSRVFLHYQAIKLARTLVDTGDFEDDARVGSPRDLANYALLEVGWLLLPPEERTEHEASAGGWVYEPPDSDQRVPTALLRREWFKEYGP